MRHSNSFAAVAVAISIACAPLGLVTAAHAQTVPIDRVLREFERSGTYQLKVDGKAVPDAEIYETSVPAVLVISAALPSPVLLRPGQMVVEAVSAVKIARQADGSMALLADAELRPLGKFRLVGANAAFTYEGHAVSLDQNPPLLGQQTSADLRQHDPAYERAAAGYELSPTAVGSLRAAGVPVLVRVVFGSWCTFCRVHVPKLLQLEQALAGSEVAFEFYGLPSPPAAWKDAEAVKLKISSTPTAIVFIRGKAVGRLAGGDWSAPEVELARLVSAWK